MKILKAMVKSRLWFITAIIVIVLVLVVSLVLTQVGFIYETFNGIHGGERRKLVSGNPHEYVRYDADYNSKQDVLDAANALNEKIAADGMILLKNEQNFLPLRTTKSNNQTAQSDPKISVFGKNSVNLVYGGSGSSEKDASASVSLQDALTDAGYDVNPVLTEFYKSSASGSGREKSPEMGNILTGFPTGETPQSSYTDQVKDSYREYNDAAIVVISRLGGEGYDLPRTMFTYGSGYTTWSHKSKERVPVDGARAVDDHYLQLDANETALIQEVSKSFENIIVVINCAQAMELGFLDDPGHYAYSDKIKAAVWVGSPGATGINALGDILNGNVNPSGHTVDTFARDFKNDPTWANFGNNLSGEGNQYTVDGKLRSNYFVDYEEGIYVGYRYYETRDYTEGSEPYVSAAGEVHGTNTTAWDSWYDSRVVYPLGYGLSYTEFEYSIENEAELESITSLNSKSEITVKVNVRNKGGEAGKAVVQLYATAPYNPDNKPKAIEKAHKVLVGYEKTDVIPVDGTASVEITVPAYCLASYDYNDDNTNTFKGYEIEHGTYVLSLSENAHVAVQTVDFTLGEDLLISADPVTDTQVTNQWDDVSGRITQYMSRKDFEGTFPQAPTEQEREVTQEFLNSMNYDGVDEGKPWYTDKMPVYQKSAKGKTEIQLYELIGKEYGDPLWNQFLDQLTVEEMTLLVGKGMYSTTAIDRIGKYRTVSADGPVGFAAFMGDPAVHDTCFYASGCMVAATYNKELAEELGVMLGNESLIGDTNDEASAYHGATYSSWYAPAVNIHRSPFGGRNWEYYSEDGLLSGSIGASVIRGAESKGVATYVKHFALNDQETRRCDGVSTWANEQAMREIYLRAFEICVKDGGSTGVMSSFNRIGSTWTGGDYSLLTQVLRNEWGFVGSVITDFNLPEYAYMVVDQMIRAGGDISLSQNKLPSSDAASLTATHVTALRNASHNMLYTIVNSNAMNGYGEGVVFRNTIPAWVEFMIWIDVAIIAILAIWGVFAVRATLKKMNGTGNGAAAEVVDVQNPLDAEAAQEKNLPVKQAKKKKTKDKEEKL